MSASLAQLVADASGEPLRFDWERLLSIVSEVYWVPLARLRGRDRSARVALARQVAMTIAMDAGLTSVEAARYFDRDHGTALHAHKVIYELARSGSARERAWLKAVLDQFNEWR